MKKHTIIIIIAAIGSIILFLNSFKIFKYFMKQNTHTINVYNKSDFLIDSIYVKTCISCKEIVVDTHTLKVQNYKKYKIDISDYKPKGKDNFFFINTYQGEYYISSVFNYHDSWGVTSSESDIYVYNDFISSIELKNPKRPKEDNTQMKFKIKP